ncbi:unnamed protein product [Bursaphelenchus xylophilus]|uniref:glutathione transferase n=1 Tax=Bursaphelenchus xylophilus TaxID=6326 RepID=A0A1I7SAK8_BURXY|nr:unnamed protein product [Bursaphelenchus xylophilus]CAG9079252.1 unnamed protein product [Bursaphelenchus xylophilus]
MAAEFFRPTRPACREGRGGLAAQNRHKSHRDQNKSRFQSTESSYVFDTFLRRVHREQRREVAPPPIPSVDNDIVLSQAWLPQLEYAPTERHKEEDELEQLFATQLADVTPVPKITKYGRFKFYFFDVRDLGEPIRLMFHYMKESFEDVRIADADWPNEQHKFPLKTLPALEHDGMTIHKSAAIARYLADIFGLKGRDRRQNAIIDEFFEVHLEAMAEFHPFLRAAAGIDEAQKQISYEEVAMSSAKRYFPIYSRVIGREMSGFIVGNLPTWPDFYAADFLDRIYTAEPRLFNDFPDLFGYFKGILGMKNIREYVESRKFSIL